MLCESGADVAIAGRKQGPLDDVSAAINAKGGGRCIGIPTDVRDAAAAANLIAQTVAAFGGLDLLINNAGKGWHAPLRTMSPEVWQNDFALNMHGSFYCAQAAFPHLKESPHGAIVNVSSLAGQNGTMGVGAYSAAKSGVQMFTRVAAAEWGPHGIRVNCVAPGMIATELAQANWAKTGFDAASACEAFPLRRPGRPHEVASAVLFLASDAASYITGETLAVGGRAAAKGHDRCLKRCRRALPMPLIGRTRRLLPKPVLMILGRGITGPD